VRREAGVPADARGVAGRGGGGDVCLDVGGYGEFGGLVEVFAGWKQPGTGGDRRGERTEVAEFSPFGAAEPEAADVVGRIGSHRLLHQRSAALAAALSSESVVREG